MKIRSPFYKIFHAFIANNTFFSCHYRIIILYFNTYMTCPHQGYIHALTIYWKCIKRSLSKICFFFFWNFRNGRGRERDRFTIISFCVIIVCILSSFIWENKLMLITRECGQQQQQTKMIRTRTDKEKKTKNYESQ